MIRRLLQFVGFSPLFMTSACINVKMDPIQVHATVDVNVKVDQALADFFGDLDRKSSVIATTPNP